MLALTVLSEVSASVRRFRGAAAPSPGQPQLFLETALRGSQGCFLVNDKNLE